MNNPSKKIFVGGVALTADDMSFKAYFEQFGRVVEAQIIRDRSTGRSRGFGFVTFQEEAAVEAVVAHRHVIQGKEVEVKMAEPRKQQPLVHHVIQPVLVPSGALPPGTSGFPLRDLCVVYSLYLGFPMMGQMPFFMSPMGVPQMPMVQNGRRGDLKMPMPIPIPMPHPMLPQFQGLSQPEGMQWLPQHQLMHHQVTEEERELLEQLRARKRASEQPQLRDKEALGPMLIRKRKSYSDDPRKRGPLRGRSSSREHHHDPSDLDLDSLHIADGTLEAFEEEDSEFSLQSNSPQMRARLSAEIFAPLPVPGNPLSRSSTPTSATTSTPVWSDSEGPKIFRSRGSDSCDNVAACF